MTSVKVAVRVRPLNLREDGLSSQVIIQMEGEKTRIVNPKVSEHAAEGDVGRDALKVREFTFDHSFWSVNENDSHYVSQEVVFTSLGEDVVQSAFDGYNICIFAYGQTGSGKTHTMMGSEDDPGLIPRYCNALFSRLSDNTASYQIHVSYLEIYNEKVRDLLKNVNSNYTKSTHNLRVREHPRDGPYVQDLSKHSVITYEALASLMKKGNSNRTTASTNMNDVSSRSHAIFTITFTQARYLDGLPSERQSKINLVDLAGSERADASGATGIRLKEGGSINKSLVSLGNVISLLAERSESGSRGKHTFIPYRDSVLTWLLKDSLGGNAKTIMIATISPADVNYGETLSTLRYANRAKNIINRPTVNEDANVKLIRELREEIARLRALLEGSGEASPKVQEKLHENEARIKVLTEEWAEKWSESAKLIKEKNLALRKEGVGVVLDSSLPHLISIDDDVLSTGIKLFHLKEGITKIGSEESEESQDITIFGAGVEPDHCIIEYVGNTVVLHPIEGALCAVNNHVIKEPTKLQQGMVITLGHSNVFRYNNPEEAKQMKKNLQVRKSSSTLSLPPGDLTTAPRLNILSQSMSELYRSNESLALNGSGWDISSKTYREDQEMLEQKRLEIMELEDMYVKKEEQRKEQEKQILLELEEKTKQLSELEEQLELIKSKGNPYDNLVQSLRELDRQEEELLEDLKISKDNLLKEIENVTWFPDQVQEEASIVEILQDLERQMAEKQGEISRVKLRKEENEHILREKKKQLEQAIVNEECAVQTLKTDYETEERQLLSTNSNLLLETQDLNIRASELRAQHDDIEEENRKRWKEELEALNEHALKIEEAWNDLKEHETQCKNRLQTCCETGQEKSEIEDEFHQLLQARSLLQKEEKSFSQHQQEEMARVEREIETWEKQRQAELDALEVARQQLLWQHSDNLQQLSREMEEKQVKVEEMKEALKDMDIKLSDSDPEVLQLENELNLLAGEREEMERKTEEKEKQRKNRIEELEAEIESLEDMYKVNLDEIQKERLRLVGLQEEVLKKIGINEKCSTEQLEEHREQLMERKKELEDLKEKLEFSAQQLEARQREFEEERDRQLDTIEFEKLKLMDMERQDRLNSLVEQEVKCRLFEEKLERERLRKIEREKDKLEREKEIQRLKNMHQKEIDELKARLDISGHNMSSNRVTRSQSCETMTLTEEKKKLMRQLTLTEAPVLLNIEIPTFVLRGSGKDLHYEYLVKITIGEESWYVFRRYSRFREMHNALKKKYPLINQLVFPPRKFFHKNKKVASERRMLLEEYVRHAIELCMRIPECPLHPSKNKHLTKQVFIDFEPFFRRGLFETARNLTT
uniref:Kinesin motor domain-containing protein n=1 Tax=Biomphalaria glabrata TaxID=6526 RepID=A0A2C9JEX7_BIOGL